MRGSIRRQLGAVASKRQILEEAGYTYNFDRMVYLNRSTKKVFSVEFVEDHSADQLKHCINEGAKGTGLGLASAYEILMQSDRAGWRFYFNSPPPAAVIRELESALG